MNRLIIPLDDATKALIDVCIANEARKRREQAERDHPCQVPLYIEEYPPDDYRPPEPVKIEEEVWRF